MNTRFLAGAAAAVSAVLLAGCAGNSVGSSNAADSGSSAPAASGGGTVTISGQNFTEAEIVADMYAGVLKKAGYDPQVKLVGTRDIYMKVFPKSVDVVPEYVGGILEFLNGTSPHGLRPSVAQRRELAAVGLHMRATESCQLHHRPVRVARSRHEHISCGIR